MEKVEFLQTSMFHELEIANYDYGQDRIDYKTYKKRCSEICLKYADLFAE